jgi:hypothetical protein
MRVMAVSASWIWRQAPGALALGMWQWLGYYAAVIRTVKCHISWVPVRRVFAIASQIAIGQDSAKHGDCEVA